MAVPSVSKIERSRSKNTLAERNVSCPASQPSHSKSQCREGVNPLGPLDPLHPAQGGSPGRLWDRVGWSAPGVPGGNQTTDHHEGSAPKGRREGARCHAGTHDPWGMCYASWQGVPLPSYRRTSSASTSLRHSRLVTRSLTSHQR